MSQTSTVERRILDYRAGDQVRPHVVETCKLVILLHHETQKLSLHELHLKTKDAIHNGRPDYCNAR